jgi:ABC-2 type transport system ATP-binding protein
LIQAIPGIIQVSVKENGIVEYESMPGQDVRAQVARQIIEDGYDLLHLQPINMSLEDIFLQLTRDEPAAADAMPEFNTAIEEQ